MIGTAALAATVGVAMVLHSRTSREAGDGDERGADDAGSDAADAESDAARGERRGQAGEPSTEPSEPSTKPNGAGGGSRRRRRAPRITREAEAGGGAAVKPTGGGAELDAPKPAPLAAIQSPDAKKEPTAPVKLEGEGTLLLASSPWCNVRIDGVDKGPTPLSVKLPAGKHTVVLTNPEFKISRTLPVMIMPNETIRKRYDF